MADVNQITRTAGTNWTAGVGWALAYVKARSGTRQLFCKFCGMDMFSVNGGRRGFCSDICATRHCARAAAAVWFRVI
jgi:hypothetical protein